MLKGNKSLTDIFNKQELERLYILLIKYVDKQEKIDEIIDLIYYNKSYNLKSKDLIEIAENTYG